MKKSSSKSTPSNAKSSAKGASYNVRQNDKAAQANSAKKTLRK